MIIKQTKKAFSMITAIFVIVIMATVSALIMNVSGKTVKATTQQYQKEQAALLARSYTELAILYVMHYDRTAGDCLQTITDHFGAAGDNGYDITMNIKYIGNDDLLANCVATNIDMNGNLSGGATWVDNTQSGFNKSISLVIDTFITYKDFDDPSNRDITFHRRTLQKL
ncbi:MAG TPA: type II secretion system protein [Campylobacterales bacterium]|nr:type II secretion system protein [Campylobacterales bacterium]